MPLDCVFSIKGGSRATHKNFKSSLYFFVDAPDPLRYGVSDYRGNAMVGHATSDPSGRPLADIVAIGALCDSISSVLGC